MRASTAPTVLVKSMVMQPSEAAHFRQYDGRAQIINLENAGHFDMLAPESD